jgi:PAS domain S-box-containing protein
VSEKLLGSRGAFTDTTASFFVALVEASSDLVAMASFDGQVLFVNKAGRELCGIAADRDVRELKLTDFHTEDGMARAAIIKAQGKWEGEGVLRHFVTGELIPVQVSSFIARDASGAPLCFATVQRDLRETKRIEAQLREAQRMDALGRLAGGVAHDFNNLLTVIIGNTTLLRGAIEGASSQGRLREIEHAAKSAAELTRQLLVFGRRQMLERRVVDLREIVERLRTLFGRLIGEDVHIELALCPSAATALVDPTQIEQIVVNLVLNARDAMPSGGTLRVGVDVVPSGEAATRAPSTPAGPSVRITVTDTGTGMGPDVRARVFDPFFTTKPVGKGTGLGLSIAYGAVRQNEGDIAFESEVGRGTTFFVTFPFVKRGNQGRREKDTGLPRGTERVWLVEDQPLVRSFVETALSRLGYSVRSFASGEQLLESMASLGEVDLLITDMVLPNIDGRMLAKRVLVERPGIRVVFASGYSEDVASRHGELPADATFIAKPFTVDDLAKAVRETLDPPKAPGRIGCRRALVVDDDPIILTVVAELLRALGCAASTHKNADEIVATIAKAASSGAPVDIIFLDLHLDGASGLDICKHLRQSGVDIAIICMSGDPLSSSEYAAAGFDDVVGKPVDHEALRACIERYAGWSHGNARSHGTAREADA